MKEDLKVWRGSLISVYEMMARRDYHEWFFDDRRIGYLKIFEGRHSGITSWLRRE